ncbi:hypothetical protein [Aquicella lusitana]|uniref:WH2 domain-containing protein n=2 Tax=Aquicella lusitana TaxID=254246 RepID=A0A370GJD1_9COXI|nr:hypothetical protein [Aquicella lusitana]RDI43771.1 hypothetical protein C8D86_11041 [Aquicella lusitana]VVC74498.1 hypothetical protein AQULUS_22640 [Aquicella lusitana]
MESYFPDQNTLRTNLINIMFDLSGFPTKVEGIVHLQKMGEKKLVELFSIHIGSLNLKKFSQSERLLFIDTAVKSGNLEVVKMAAEKFIKEGYEDDIRIPSKDNPEQPFRPVFWLASIVSRQPGIPAENYRAIEEYLCQKFNIPNTVNINGKNVTRKEYLAGVELWKHSQNVKFLKELGFKKPRYRRHELMDDIEKGVKLKPFDPKSK